MWTSVTKTRTAIFATSHGCKALLPGECGVLELPEWCTMVADEVIDTLLNVFFLHAALRTTLRTEVDVAISSPWLRSTFQSAELIRRRLLVVVTKKVVRVPRALYELEVVISITEVSVGEGKGESRERAHAVSVARLLGNRERPRNQMT
jgi:hypothetical protein